MSGRDNGYSANSELAARLAERLLNPDIQISHHPKQGEFIYSEIRHAALVTGIGFGKTFGGAIRALRASMGHVGNQRIRTPNLGVVTAPTYSMLRDASLRAFMEIGERWVVDFNKTEGVMKMRGGSEILWRSADRPENLRGPSISWWWGDEGALYDPIVRKIMLGRMRQFGKRGWTWLTTTPRGRNWVWQTYVRDHKDDDSYHIYGGRSHDNIYLDPEILADWESEYVGDFATQELEGGFVAFEGLIYNEFDRMKHVYRGELPKFTEVIAGVDWGFANPGVIQVIGLTGDRRAYLVAEEYAKQRRIEEWVTVAQQMRAMWGINQFYCDPSEPDNIKAFVEGGLKAQGADNRVQWGIQTVKNRLVLPPGEKLPRLVIGPDAVHTATEFEQYQWAKNRHGMRDEPVKANDHAMDALRYAIMGADNPGKRPITAETRRYA